MKMWGQMRMTESKIIKKKKAKKIKEKDIVQRDLNKTRSMWTRNPVDFTEEEYSQISSSLSKDGQDKLAVKPLV